MTASVALFGWCVSGENEFIWHLNAKSTQPGPPRRLCVCGYLCDSPRRRKSVNMPDNTKREQTH